MSGGETLCYPFLEELIRECAGRGMKASVSISGAAASKEKLLGLQEAGISSICVSLNGSTAKINDVTRQGFEEAIAALRWLKEIPDCVTLVNFVMHGSNAEDLPNLLANRLFSHVQQEEIPGGESPSCFSDDPGTSDNICEKDRKILEALLRDIRCLNEKTKHLIIVSGDIFRDGISYSDDTKRYVELLGKLHSSIAEMADRVVEVVCGIPIDH